MTASCYNNGISSPISSFLANFPIGVPLVTSSPHMYSIHPRSHLVS